MEGVSKKYHTRDKLIVHTNQQVLSSSDPAVQLTPPLNAVPTITYTSAEGLSGSAVFVPDSSYQLTDTVENDVYTFTVTVTNAAGLSSTVLSDIRGKLSVYNYIVYTL